MIKSLRKQSLSESVMCRMNRNLMMSLWFHSKKKQQMNGMVGRLVPAHTHTHTTNSYAS